MKQTNDLIRELREDRDLNQAEIAKILGIVQQTYSNYETGQFELPTRHLSTLAAYYRVNTDFLLGNTTYSGELDRLNEKYTDTVTTGELLSDALSLTKKNRLVLQSYLDYLKNTQNKK